MKKSFVLLISFIVSLQNNSSACASRGARFVVEPLSQAYRAISTQVRRVPPPAQPARDNRTKPPFEWDLIELERIEQFARTKNIFSFPKRVGIVEVSPRDGLQNESVILTPAKIINYVELLEEAGFRSIEAGALVSPKKVPSMAGTPLVLQQLKRKPGVSYPILIPTIEALDRAGDLGVKDIAVFTSVSDEFNKRNIGKTTNESLIVIRDIVHQANEKGINVRGYVSCVLGCPYEGYKLPTAVGSVSARLLDMGCDEISLGDTIGVGTPETTDELLAHLFGRMRLGPENFAMHWHDTGGRAIENMLVGLEYGIPTVDSSVGGLGGCPFAHAREKLCREKKSVGNVATEKVVYVLDRLGIETGVDMVKLLTARRFIRSQLKGSIS